MLNFLRKLSKKESRKLEDCLAQNGLAFDSQENAEKFFFTQRDQDLADIATLNHRYSDLNLDFKAKSLQRFEKFYFGCCADKTFSIEILKERMEELLT